MSHWDPNFIPPLMEGYQYFNQNYTPEGLVYNPPNYYENLSYYAPMYPQTSQYYYNNQHFNRNNRNLNSGTETVTSLDVGSSSVDFRAQRVDASSNLTPTAKEFKPNKNLGGGHGGAIKKDERYKPKESKDCNKTEKELFQNGAQSTSEKESNNKEGYKPTNKKQHFKNNRRNYSSKDSSAEYKKNNFSQSNRKYSNTAESTSQFYLEPAKNDTVPKNEEKKVPFRKNHQELRSNEFKNDKHYNRRNYHPDRDNHWTNGIVFTSRSDQGNKKNYNYQDSYNRGKGNYKENYRRSDFSKNKNEDVGYNSNDNKSRFKSNDWRQEDDRDGYNMRTNWRSRDNKNLVEKNSVKEIEDNVKQDEKCSSKSNDKEGRKNKDDKQEFKKKLNAASQRERLEEMVNRRLLECLVCCEKLKHADQVWSCKQCYHILHLNCVKLWAKSSKLEAGWRCPACQNINEEIPSEYRCYCAKVLKPRLEPGSTPHSCGEVCGKKGRNCDHTCTLLCHPGPCPDCTIMVNKICSCGSTKVLMICSSSFEPTCQKKCNKLLNCGVHRCTRTCHLKECDSCVEFIKQECFCGKVGRKVNCTKENQGETKYECGDICGKVLSCGNHHCQKSCHPGKCDPCSKSPDEVKTCPCGQSMLTEQRTSCLDPIPCCDKICSKPLKCGQPSTPHLCKNPCHEGDCPPCPLSTLVRCRCGHMDREFACVELKTKADDARCEKKCTKKRSCCKHKCNQFCCIEVEHICPLPCNRLLSCGLHRCEETCHRGRCPPCWRTSFEELYCECGASVLYPPVACGTRPPPCSKPCSRRRDCGHEVNHNCHTGTCPPCTVLTKRFCYGKHEQRSTIPCHQGDFSCGLPCGKEMPCGRHKCIQVCHTGSCPLPCTQSCTIPRDVCSHPCNAPCHEPPCPDTPCKQMVKVTCECGLRTNTRSCMELASEYQSIVMTQLASKMADIQKGQTVDISDIISNQKKIPTFKTLECNDECRLVERNRRLTIGLQIRNPDLSSKLTPRYSDYMKSWAKKDARFCQHVHDKLTELVQLAKQSKQKSRSYSFESMNRDKRHFVHECCEHFGCESAAYDQEPNRNVIATAFRDRSWLPSYSLLEVIQRENGQRKVPGPVLEKNAITKMETVSLRLPGRIPRPPTPPGEYVDYFNDPPL